MTARELPLSQDLASKTDYTFGMRAMKPTAEGAGGTTRIVDSSICPAARTIRSALFTMKPGALRELLWHPHASEWQYYIAGKGRMTVFGSEGEARTMDYNANDVGFVPQIADTMSRTLETMIWSFSRSSRAVVFRKCLWISGSSVFPFR